MSAMDAGELALFAKSLQGAASTQTGAALDAALADLGWAEALEVEPEAAIGALFEAQGGALATSSSLARVVGTALGTDGVDLVLPALGAATPAGRRAGPHVEVDGVLLGPRASGAVAVPVGDAVALVEATSLAVVPVHGIDADADLLRVSGAVDGSPEPSGGTWGSAVRLAHLALGHELVGAARAMLELARTHALTREQFGQPIAAFQAVRHRLADAYIAIEAAASLLEGAWLDGSPLSAAMAKAQAGRAGRTTARHCQQVLAGIGFTTEHPHHRYVRRVLLLDQLFGSARTLTRTLGEQLSADRRLPGLLPL